MLIYPLMGGTLLTSGSVTFRILGMTGPADIKRDADVFAAQARLKVLIDGFRTGAIKRQDGFCLFGLEVSTRQEVTVEILFRWF